PATDRVIGRFVVLSRLGAGGQGIVYLAYDTFLERKVALKLLRADAGGSARQHMRLLREAQAMARIAHPNVVTVYEAGTFGDQVYLALEHIKGQTLTDWLREPRSFSDIATNFAAAGRGLAAAHALGLIHRDFKPDNVLVAKDGRVLVTDFGIVAVHATADDDSLPPLALPLDGLTGQGAVLGTPGYIAPELHAGKTVDARADQFAFCVALDQALQAQNRPAPAWLKDIAARGKRQDRDERFPDMRAVLGALADDPTQVRR